MLTSILTTLLLAPLAASPAAGPKLASKPNVIIVLADDLGFSDLGCYGSEIATPNLDKLAADGLRFTQFYNTAKCHSSRVSLLSGRWCRQAGDTKLSRAAVIPEWTTDAQMQLPRGGHQTFAVKHDGQWQPVILKIPETRPLHALRLDPCSAPGDVVIENLQLREGSEKVLQSWP